MPQPAATGIRGFSEVTLQIRDLHAAASFYVDVFGLRVLSTEADRIWLAVGEHARLGLWRPGEKEFGDEGGAHVHFAFAVERDEVEKIAGRARAAGAEVDGPHAHDGGDRSLYVTDPAGNIVEAWDFFDHGQTVADLDDQADDRGHGT